MKKSEKKWELNWDNKKLALQLVEGYKGRNSGRDRGNGVFAKLPVKKGEILSIFGGYIIPIGAVGKLPQQLQEYCYQVSDNFLYGPVKESEVSVSEHYNHSCSPNAGFKDSITLIAIRNIKKGEEITFDYATCMTTNKFEFKCRCGNKNCRSDIKGTDWKLPELQKKYRNHFQPYILEKILKVNKK
jgi:uncharacterized protein